MPVAMKMPSSASKRLIQAAKSAGSTRMAYHGNVNATMPAASTSNATCVAVSKPRPISRPTGYRCHGLFTRRITRGQQPGQETPVLKLPFEFGLVEVAVAHGAEHLGDAHDGEQVRQPDQDQEGPGDERAHQPEGLQHRRALVLHGSDDGAHADAPTETPARTPRWNGPSENQKPADSERVPSPTSLRVVLSITAMWSASKACRTPSR